MGNRGAGIYPKYKVSRRDEEDREGRARQLATYIVLDVSFDFNSREAAKRIASELDYTGPFALAVRHRHEYNVTRTDQRDLPGGDRFSANLIVLDLYYCVASRRACLIYADSVEKDGYILLAKDLRDMVKIAELEYESNNPATGDKEI